jgi:hypothetical protein
VSTKTDELWSYRLISEHNSLLFCSLAALPPTPVRHRVSLLARATVAHTVALSWPPWSVALFRTTADAHLVSSHFLIASTPRTGHSCRRSLAHCLLIKTCSPLPVTVSASNTPCQTPQSRAHPGSQGRFGLALAISWLTGLVFQGPS